MAEGATNGLAEKLDALLVAFFPGGLGAMTSLPFIEEAAAVEAALLRVKQEHADTVNEAGLEPLVRRIAKANEKYKAALHKAATKSSTTPDFGTVRASRATGQDYLLQVIVQILAKFPSASAQDQKSRTELLKPILAQNEQIRAALKGRRSPTDVDPDTGDAGLAPAPDAGAEPA